MTELKTLQDMIIPKMKSEFINRKKLVSRIELKKEAINWIKELNTRKNSKEVNDNFGSYHDFDNLMDYKNIINWIKFFFNITEEDLKC